MASVRAGAAGLLVALAGGCLPFQGRDPSVLPEVPSARQFAHLSPGARARLLPPPQRFSPTDFLQRLVCPTGDHPGWRTRSREGGAYRLVVDCPGGTEIAFTLDTSSTPPPAPEPLRQLAVEGFAPYREAIELARRKQFEPAFERLDEALEFDPREPVYLRERVFFLYAAGRTAEALLAADALIDEAPTPMLHKYRALAARDLGLFGEMIRSLDAIMTTAPRGHPLLGEATCAQGLVLASAGDPRARELLDAACRAGQRPCCQRLDKGDVAPP